MVMSLAFAKGVASVGMADTARVVRRRNFMIDDYCSK